MELDHLSPSSISEYLKCPRHWEYRHVKKEPAPKSIVMVNSSAVHASVHHSARHRITSGLWLPQWDMQDFYASELDVLIDKEEAGVKFDTLTHGTALDTGVGIIKTYYPTLTALNPIDTEIPVAFYVDGIKTIGYVDMLAERERPYELVLSDLKSRGKTPNKGQDFLQLLFYQIGIREWGLFPTYAEVHSVVTMKTKVKMHIERYPTPTEAEFELGFNMIKEVAGSIVAEKFPPIMDGWHCSAKYCEYYGICRGKETEL
jgi:CRISPR/Cas system-associated exonuclease Cas4 (RecB family)